MIYAHTSTIYHTPWEGGSGIFFASETTLSWRWWLVRWKIVWVCFHPFWSCDLIPMHLRLLTCYGLPGNPTTVFGKDCGGTPGNWWNLLTKQKVVETISGSHGFYNFLKLQFLGLITTCLFWTKFPKTWDPTNGVQKTTFLELVFTTVLLSYIESKSRNAWQFIVFRKTVVISTHHSLSHRIHAGEAEAKTKLLEEFVGILRWWGIQISSSYTWLGISVHLMLSYLVQQLGHEILWFLLTLRGVDFCGPPWGSLDAWCQKTTPDKQHGESHWGKLAAKKIRPTIFGSHPPKVFSIRSLDNLDLWRLRNCRKGHQLHSRTGLGDRITVKQPMQCLIILLYIFCWGVLESAKLSFDEAKRSYWVWIWSPSFIT